MTAAMRTPYRPDDVPVHSRHRYAVVEAGAGHPYTLERRSGRVIRLARAQRNGQMVSIAFSPTDARAVAAALTAAADELENE